MRPGFRDIVSGWMLTDDFEGLTDRIERAAEFVRRHGPLEEDERATARMMIECQIVRAMGPRPAAETEQGEEG